MEKKKNIITETVKQYISAKYGRNDIESFDIALVVMNNEHQNLPDCITGIGFTIEEAMDDLIAEDDFRVQAFEDSASLANYELTWNGYNENGCDVVDGYFRLDACFAYLCNAYLKSKCSLQDIFAYGIKDYKISGIHPSSMVPAEVFACKEPELIVEI